MSLERYTIDSNRERCASRQHEAVSAVADMGAALQKAIDELEKSYAEIDRLTVENADLQKKNAGLYKETGLLMNRAEQAESAQKRLTAERDKLAAELDNLRGKQAEPSKPEWTPPKSLKDGVYSVGGGTLRNAKITMTYAWARDAFSDFSVPSFEGRWRIADGKAEYLGP